MTRKELLTAYDNGKRDFSNANLRDVDLRNADLHDADLRCADLRGVDLSEANLRKVNLSWANLSGANLRWADLKDADLSKADLSKANLSGANLIGANLSKVNLQSAIGNMQEIKSLQLDMWSIIYTTEILTIGCKQFTIEEWKNFTDDEITKMHSVALTWWKKWKLIIFNIIEMTNK